MQIDRLRRNLTTVAALVLLASAATRLHAADVYTERIQPFMRKYCIECHSSKKPRGELDLTRYSRAADVSAAFRHWTNVIGFIQKGEMPPQKAAKQPTLEERAAVVKAVKAILLAEAKKRAGDPGVILPRRLSRTEFDQSVRDLTGVDIKPTKNFPPDPAAGEGFDNTGEALTMSPSLLKKYLAAAQQVSNHLVLKTDGITFAPFPVTSYNERKKLTEQAIIDFYMQREVRIADYLEAAWRYRYRQGADRDVSVATWAGRQKLSGKYLALVWKTLSEASSTTGYLKQLGELWNAIPAPSGKDNRPQQLVKLNQFVEFCRRTLCHREERLIRSNAGNWPISHLDFRAKTAALRDRFDPRNLKSRHLLQFDQIRVPRNKRQRSEELALRIRVEPTIPGSKGNFVLLHRLLFSKAKKLPRNDKEKVKHEVVTLRAFLAKHAPDLLKRLPFGRHPQGGKIDPDSIALQAPALIEIPLGPDLIRLLNGKHLLVDCELDPKYGREGSVRLRHSSKKRPNDLHSSDGQLLVHANSKPAKMLAVAAKRFCQTFPNRFFYVDRNRGLAAGFHLVEGFFRDDRPLVTKVLNEKDVRELDRLWRELDFVTNSAETLIRGFVWFERSERHVLHDKRFDFLRPEDPKLVEEKLLGRFERVYLGKMGIKLLGDSLKPEKPSDKYTMIHGFFEQIRHGLARRRQLMLRAEQRGLRDLESIARRAYRRSLRPSEVKSLKTMYAAFRKQGQGVEGALRGVFTAILLSPEFCYHFTHAPPGKGVSPLSDNALASRLSFFLWSSLPDDKLLSAAQRGEFQSTTALRAHTRRMLKDPKIDSFAREFFGQWLRYRDYLSKDPINAKTFPGYTDALRRAMAEEPVRLATSLIQQDKPITDLLNSDTTFVNGVLARHYGSDIEEQYRAQLAKWVADHKRRGIPLPTKPEEQWHRVNGLRKSGRGGLFGMGVVLTKNSAGERTSPVKRGFWAVHHLLGQHFPPPPTDVPELPTNEKTTKKSIRELIRLHVADAKCAMCHVHFDSLGLAMEGFDPIGRARTKDLAGRPIDNVAKFPDGTTGKGISGLINYVERHRRRDFVQTMCRKFLGYALGRSVLLSDQPLLNEMETALEKNDYRFSVLFETVVGSPQFRKQRGRDYPSTRR